MDLADGVTWFPFLPSLHSTLWWKLSLQCSTARDLLTPRVILYLGFPHPLSISHGSRWELLWTTQGTREWDDLVLLGLVSEYFFSIPWAVAKPLGGLLSLVLSRLHMSGLPSLIPPEEGSMSLTSKRICSNPVTTPGSPAGIPAQQASL